MRCDGASKCRPISSLSLLDSWAPGCSSVWAPPLCCWPGKGRDCSWVTVTVTATRLGTKGLDELTLPREPVSKEDRDRERGGRAGREGGGPGPLPARSRARTSVAQGRAERSPAQSMSLLLLEPGHVARKRQSFGDATGPRAVAVEIVSAELAQDGGPAPDVRCTVAPRSSGGASPRVVGTSVCRGAWGPVWKETLRLDMEPGGRSARFVDLVLWDESGGEGGESSCLGELVPPSAPDACMPPLCSSSAFDRASVRR